MTGAVVTFILQRYGSDHTLTLGTVGFVTIMHQTLVRAVCLDNQIAAALITVVVRPLFFVLAHRCCFLPFT